MQFWVHEMLLKDSSMWRAYILHTFNFFLADEATIVKCARHNLGVHADHQQTFLRARIQFGEMLLVGQLDASFRWSFFFEPPAEVRQTKATCLRKVTRCIRWVQYETWYGSFHYIEHILTSFIAKVDRTN